MTLSDTHDYPTRRQLLKAGAAVLSGLAIAACAALFYSPFSQRMLVRMAWPSEITTTELEN